MTYTLFEELFNELKLAQTKNEKTRTCDKLSRELNKLLHTNRSSIILKEDAGDDFFGMYIMPLDMLKYTKHVVKENSKISDLCDTDILITVDHKLLYTSTPRELVAVMLHEIGHIVMDDDFHKAVKYRTLLTMGTIIPNTIMSLTFHPILAIPMIMIFMASSQAVINNYTEEAHADSFAIKEGYGDELLSVFSKIKLKQGSNLKMREAETKAEIKVYMEWTLSNFLRLTTRKMSIIRQIDKFSKELSFHPDMDHIKTSIIHKLNKPELQVDLLQEGIFFSKKFDIHNYNDRIDLEKRISHLDILIDSDIKDIGDKCEYNETVFNMLKQVNMALRIEKDPDFIDILKGLNKLLYNMREKIANKEIPKSPYGILLDMA